MGLRLPICEPRRVSTGFGTVVTDCRINPLPDANNPEIRCTINNIAGGGGALIHCLRRTSQVFTVTITFLDANLQTRRTVVKVTCN